MKNFVIILALGCCLLFIAPLLGIPFKMLSGIWNTGTLGPLFAVSIVALLGLLGYFIKDSGSYGLPNPALHRYYHVWTAKDGVSVPMKFEQVKQHPPETLVCMMHGGVGNPGAWLPLKDYTERGIPRKGAQGRPHLPHPDLWSTFTAGPQPPNFSS